MATILTRETTGPGATTNLGAPLTSAQIDANFMGLNAGKQESNEKDALNGYAGLTSYKINLKSGSITSFLSTEATIARTWIFPDKSGTLATLADIPTTLPASDVSAWAKESVRPTYTAGDVGAQPVDPDLSAIAALTDTIGFLKKSANNTWVIDTTDYHLPIAAAGSLGGVRVGTGLAIDTNGVLSAAGATDIAEGTRTINTVTITSSTGTAATLNIATASFAGLLSATHFSKLENLPDSVALSLIFGS